MWSKCLAVEYYIFVILKMSFSFSMISLNQSTITHPMNSIDSVEMLVYFSIDRLETTIISGDNSDDLYISEAFATADWGLGVWTWHQWTACVQPVKHLQGNFVNCFLLGCTNIPDKTVLLFNGIWHLKHLISCHPWGHMQTCTVLTRVKRVLCLTN